jgi:hypothetical protein
MHRRRDALGRFLSTPPFLDNNLEPAYNQFEEGGDQDINPFSENLLVELPLVE